MLKLSEFFGVKEGEEFKIEDYNNIFLINWNRLFYKNSSGQFQKVNLTVNEIIDKEITKLPKKKEFTDDELVIMRSLPKNYKWIARDLGIDCAVIFKCKPTKDKYGNWLSEGDCCILSIFNHLFQNITTEDEEPVCIDNYVER